MGVLVAGLLNCGCSSSATLTLRDGQRVRGRIIRSDARTVWVERPSIDFTEPPIGQDVVVELDSGKELAGRLTRTPESDPRRSIANGKNGERVCIDRPGESALCLPAERIAYLELAPMFNRDDIADVDHPGDGEMAVGAGILGFGALLVLPTLIEGCGEGPSSAGCGAFVGPAVVLFGVPGLALTIDGLVTYIGSRSRAAPPDTAAVQSSVHHARGVALGVAF